MVSPSRLLLDNTRQQNGEATQCPPPLRSGKLTDEKKKPSETLTERFRELAVSCSVKVCANCSMLHNFDYDLYGTVFEYAIRLYIKDSLIIFSVVKTNLNTSISIN